jgi:uncharacterized protein YehS (DUF1456 family)
MNSEAGCLEEALDTRDYALGTKDKNKEIVDKSEIRISKSETNSNFRNPNDRNILFTNSSFLFSASKH